MRRYSIYILVLFSSALGVAQANSTFDEAVRLYQAKEFDRAEPLFKQVTQANPNSPSAWYNLGQLAFEKKQVGRALAYWRQALEVDSDFMPATKAVGYLSQISQVKISSQEPGFIEGLRWQTLRTVPGWALWVSLSLLTIALGFATLQSIGARRRALSDDQPMPNASWTKVPWIVLYAIWPLLLTLTLIKQLDPKIDFATVIENSAALSSPGGVGSSLFEFAEGAEVVVHEIDGEYAQASQLGGAAGWVPLSRLYIYAKERGK